MIESIIIESASLEFMGIRYVVSLMNEHGQFTQVAMHEFFVFRNAGDLTTHC